MIEIRFHGRGGQGAVVASEILANAFFFEDNSVQTFPEFGVERRGAPVAAYLRIDKKQVLVRCKIYEPDHIIVLDPTLLNAVDVTVGLKPDGWILVNSNRKPDELGFPAKFRVATIDATSLAIKYHLGPRTSPIVNTAILGAFSNISRFMPIKVSMKSICDAIKKKVPIQKENNIKAAKEAYNLVVTKEALLCPE